MTILPLRKAVIHVFDSKKKQKREYHHHHHHHYHRLRSPERMASVELFPAPLMPSRPKHSPRGMPREVLFTATFAPLLAGYTLRSSETYNTYDEAQKQQHKRKSTKTHNNTKKIHNETK